METTELVIDPATMENQILKAHTCKYCKSVNIFAAKENILIRQPSYMTAYRTESYDMAYTGLRLNNLQEGSRNGCSFGEYLVAELQDGYPEGLSWYEMKLYTNGVEFYGLLPLEKALPSDHGPELPGKPHYIPVPAHKQGKARGSGKFPRYFLSTDQDVPFEVQRKWKPIVADPLLDATAASIHDWKLRCESNQALDHTVCSPTGPKFLPSRLIAIQKSQDKYQLKLINGKLLRDVSEYAALSYCWGGALRTALTRNTLISYQEEIPWDHIPQTIRDAIIASQRLGIYFVWVDSFCIVQDSDDDKNQEIGQMNQVYTHSALTIVARRAINAHSGFLHQRELPAGTTLVHYLDKFGQTWQCTLTFDSAADGEDETLLDTRGWTLQEYLLSRRLLIVGTWTTVWSCRKERYENSDGWFLDRMKGDPFYFQEPWHFLADGSAFQGTHQLDAIAFFSAHKEYQHPRPNDRSVKESWQTLVSQYTHRSLSVPTDRILAISGLAELFSHVRGGTYAAGLWVQDFPSALAWYHDSDILSPRPSVKQGPSWSWTAINGPIAWSSPNGKEVAKVESTKCELNYHKSLFGSVTHGVLEIRGPACGVVWRVTEKTPSQNLSTDVELGFPVATEFSSNTGVDFIADARELEPDTTWLAATLLAIKVDDYCLKGIVLRDEPNSENSRLGYFRIPVNGDAWAHHCLLPLCKDWEEKAFTII